MKRFVVLIFVLFPLFLSAQQRTNKLITISRDSLPYDLYNNWKFQFGDDSNWASPYYTDSNWRIVHSGLYMHTSKKSDIDTFNSIGWFRLHFIADTTVTNLPLALSMTEAGACEVYLDGKKQFFYGAIKGKAHSVYFDPQGIPYILTFSRAGEHLLAVRYANYNAQKNYNLFQNNNAGFALHISYGNTYVPNKCYQLIANTTMFMFMFGIFITLSFLHLFLFLYYRAARSNLFFSIFCLSLALLFFTPFLIQTSNNPQTISIWIWIGITAGVVSCFSLSSFINDLFGKKKLRYYIISILCLITLVSYFIDSDTGTWMLMSIIFIVSLEAVVLTIRAIIKKLPGARILGFGIVLFTLLILISITALITEQNLSFSDDTIAGQIGEYLVALSIFSVPGSMSIYLAWSYSRISKNLKSQLEQVEVLSAKTIEQEKEKKRMLETQNEQLEKEVVQRTAEIAKQHEELKAEKKKSDDLLNNILPEEVADELKQRGTSSARFFDHVTVLFTDFVNFTMAGERMSPQELVDELNTCFKTFDEIISKYNIEKIKTIGDAYLAVCGLPVEDPNHAINVVNAAIEIKQFITGRKQVLGDKTFEIRIGIHSGSVVAGIVGLKKFAYDIWGDTVNTAARMEQNSQPGKINISQTTYELIKDQFSCTYRGEITAKNKGELRMYFVNDTFV